MVVQANKLLINRWISKIIYHVFRKVYVIMFIFLIWNKFFQLCISRKLFEFIFNQLVISFPSIRLLFPTYLRQEISVEWKYNCTHHILRFRFLWHQMRPHLFPDETLWFLQEKVLWNLNIFQKEYNINIVIIIYKNFVKRITNRCAICVKVSFGDFVFEAFVNSSTAQMGNFTFPKVSLHPWSEATCIISAYLRKKLSFHGKFNNSRI